MKTTIDIDTESIKMTAETPDEQARLWSVRDAGFGHVYQVEPFTLIFPIEATKGPCGLAKQLRQHD